MPDAPRAGGGSFPGDPTVGSRPKTWTTGGLSGLVLATPKRDMRAWAAFAIVLPSRPAWRLQVPHHTGGPVAFESIGYWSGVVQTRLLLRFPARAVQPDKAKVTRAGVAAVRYPATRSTTARAQAGWRSSSRVDRLLRRPARRPGGHDRVPRQAGCPAIEGSGRTSHAGERRTGRGAVLMKPSRQSYLRTASATEGLPTETSSNARSGRPVSAKFSERSGRRIRALQLFSLGKAAGRFSKRARTTPCLRGRSSSIEMSSPNPTSVRRPGPIP